MTSVKVPRRGFGKIQLLSAEAMFGQNGIWHAKDTAELSAAMATHKDALQELHRQPHLSPAVKDKLTEALRYSAHGQAIPPHIASQLVSMLNSAAFRTAGSSTMQWTAWTASRNPKAPAISVKKSPVPVVSTLPQADVYVQLGNKLFRTLRSTTRKVSSAVVGAIDEARRRHPKATVDELRELAATVASEGVFAPSRTKALTKVDYKFVKGPKGKVRAAIIDVSSELLGLGFSDDILKSYKLQSGLSKSLAGAFLQIDAQERKKLPKNVAIMVRDNQLAGQFKGDIESLRGHLEAILREHHGKAGGDVEVSVVLQPNVQKRAENIPRAAAHGVPFTGLKVQRVGDGKSVSPELIIRYGRFPLSTEADAELEKQGVKVLDHSDFVIAADKTVNGRVTNLLKLEPMSASTVFVPRNAVSQNSLFSTASDKELDAILERAKVENWSGVVVKLPTKLTLGKTGQEAVTAHFVNPHSPLQVDALRKAIRDIRFDASAAPDAEKKKAKLAFEELAVSSLPELGGRGLELRTLAMPRFKVSKITTIVEPNH